MRRSGPPWGAWLSSTPWAGRYLACRPAVPALVNVSPVKWALVKFTSLPEVFICPGAFGGDLWAPR